MKTKTLILLTFITIFVACLFMSCGRNYPYKWEVSVIYTNGDTDTLNCEFNAESDDAPRLCLVGANGGCCLIISEGFNHKTVACGVRKYEILKVSKVK